MKTKIPTLTQAKNKYVERANAVYHKALANIKNEFETQTILDCKAIVDKPKKNSLSQLRYATDIIECMAERG